MTGLPPGAPILFSALPQLGLGWLKTRYPWGPETSDCPLSTPWQAGSRGFPQPDTHPGPHGNCCQSSHGCPPRTPELWQDGGGGLPLPLFSHAYWPATNMDLNSQKIHSLYPKCWGTIMLTSMIIWGQSIHKMKMWQHFSCKPQHGLTHFCHWNG
jgi:hypothetical protein